MAVDKQIHKALEKIIHKMKLDINNHNNKTSHQYYCNLTYASYKYYEHVLKCIIHPYTSVYTEKLIELIIYFKNSI